MKDGACQARPELNWHPEHEDQVNPKCLAVCRRCPVRKQCSEFAHTEPKEWGIWGGEWIKPYVQQATQQKADRRNGKE